ncbi:hypothetical protein A33Q_2054 [Indibacter alkaliphilus LW1]|uniref:Uncharacterized protein n=1 Tax=Indibacter alkaliphilus (strain CCUG 57479 / KCTC 22604 / LW1) TaxID=1189612 RepID=S2DCU0_INDAL|nr:hypothetical protein A33Q_2054 [Indibacter alkaliphilus LW1]
MIAVRKSIGICFIIIHKFLKKGWQVFSYRSGILENEYRRNEEDFSSIKKGA